jgi:hypothetical protein
MEAPDPNAVEPTCTPSNRGSSADGEENPYAYGSDKWFDWKIKRNGGKLRAGMSFNESNKRVAEDVKPVLEVTGDLCMSAATGPYRDIIEIGTGKDMWDQRELSGTERTVQAALTFGIPLVGAVVGNFIEYGGKLARGVNRASRAGEQVEDVLQSGLRMGSNVASNRGLLRVRTAGVASEVETYTARQIAAAIADDPIAYRSYMQLRNRVGADVVLDFGEPAVNALGRVRRIDEIEIFVRNNPTVRGAVSTFVHESRHISDLDRGVVNPLRPTVLDEYRAFRREFLFAHGHRPDSMERLNLWMWVRELYPHLPLE